MLYLIVSDDVEIPAGVGMVQFRHKSAYTRESLEAVRRLKSRLQVPLMINDRVDIALAVDAAGVHLGQTDLPIPIARCLLGQKIIGGTAGTLEQALQVEQEGADYVSIGHIFPTTSKVKTTPPVGLKALEQVCRRLKIPVYAIGGINSSNVEQVRATGVTGVALIAAITELRHGTFPLRGAALSAPNSAG
jgi:thiamine-phosphate pyrophosphorylase